MSTATSGRALHEVTATIKKFKFEELEVAVMPCFPEISWSQVKSELVKKHKTFNPTNAAQIIQEAVIRAKVPLRALNERLRTLQITDVSQHYTRKIWHGYKLMGPGKPLNEMLDREILRNIEQYFRTTDMKMQVGVVTREGIAFVFLKNQGKSRIAATPVYFAVFLDQKFLFCSRATVSRDLVTHMVNSLGYAGFKSIKLSGRDLVSLGKLCWRRKQGALDPNNIDEAPIYVDAPPDIKPTGVDFTQHKQRTVYADKCFGPDPPRLEVLVVNAPNQPWKSEYVASKLANETMHMSWEFRSPNLTAFMTKLIERRVLPTPLPYYLANLTKLGKNMLTLKHD